MITGKIATAFGVRRLGAAFVVISGSTDFGTMNGMRFLSGHCFDIEEDYKSGAKPPHSKRSADLCTGFN